MRILGLAAAAAVAFMVGQGAAWGGSCEIDNAFYVLAGDECTAYGMVRSKDEAPDAAVERLIVFLHGDMSNGHNDYMHARAVQIAERLEEQKIGRFVVLSPLRRGYEDGKGNASSGPRLERDLYTAEVVDQMQDFLRAQRTRFPRAKVTLLGHSGGAAVAGIIAGRAPMLADAVVLAGSPWNVPYWRKEYRDGSEWPNSLSPHDFVAQTTAEQIFILISSPNDNSIPLALSEAHFRALRELGRPADLVVLDGVSHNGLARETKTFDLVVQASAPALPPAN